MKKIAEPMDVQPAEQVSHKARHPGRLLRNVLFASGNLATFATIICGYRAYAHYQNANEVAGAIHGIEAAELPPDETGWASQEEQITQKRVVLAGHEQQAVTFGVGTIVSGVGTILLFSGAAAANMIADWTAGEAAATGETVPPASAETAVPPS